MNKIQDKKEVLLPPPELLERYESISKGLSKDLIDLVKREQTHRHELQNRYLTHFRLGQIFGSCFLVYIIYAIFDIANKGNFKLAYLMSVIFGLLIVLILLQYRKDRLNSTRKKINKTRNYQSKNNNYKNNHPKRRINK